MPTALDLPALRDAWRETVYPLAPQDDAAEEIFADLAARYAEAHRHYHTLSHVAQMWETLERLRPQAPIGDLTALRIALWFHDAVYDTRAADNEERSARLALEVLPRLHIPAATLAAVERLILATKAHRAAPEDGDCQALLDCDLAILGASQGEYDGYARAIRAEYAWVPAADYRAGRGAVLESFLRRERLYLTRPLFETRERQARENLRRERDALKDDVEQEERAGADGTVEQGKFDAEGLGVVDAGREGGGQAAER